MGNGARDALPSIFSSLSQAKLFRLLLEELLDGDEANDVEDSNFRRFLDHLLSSTENVRRENDELIENGNLMLF